VHARTGHGVPEGEKRHSSSISSNSALDRGGGQRHASAAVPSGISRYPFYRRLGGAQGRSRLLRRISPPTRIRSSDRPACSVSLFRLHYPVPHSTSSSCIKPNLPRTEKYTVTPSALQAGLAVMTNTMFGMCRCLCSLCPDNENSVTLGSTSGMVHCRNFFNHYE
jgi:hypothetical protein